MAVFISNGSLNPYTKFTLGPKYGITVYGSYNAEAMWIYGVGNCSSAIPAWGQLEIGYIPDRSLAPSRTITSMACLEYYFMINSEGRVTVCAQNAQAAGKYFNSFISYPFDFK